KENCMAAQAPMSDVLDTRLLLKTLVAVKKGDFSVRMPDEQTGIAGKIADTLNEIIDMNERLAGEAQRMDVRVGKEGKINHRASIGSASGLWAKSLDSLNSKISDLAQPTTEVTRVIGAVAKGDLSQTMALEIDGRPLKGEFLKTGKIVNTMVDRLGSF